MKTFLSGLAVVLVAAGVVLQASPDIQERRRQALQLQNVTLEMQRQLAKEEQRRSWRKKYLADMKRLIERLQRAYLAGELN
jgi:hypothetical protein